MATTPVDPSTAEAIAAPIQPSSQSAVMMIAAITTPEARAPNAVGIDMPRTNAITVPVHAPVPGSGTPTKRARLTALDDALPIPSASLLARESTGLQSERTTGNCSSSKVGKMGATFPATARANVCHAGSPNKKPTGTPARSSMIGIADKMNTVATSGTPKLWRYEASFSPSDSCLD